jgi:hypothetical protein
MNALAIDRQTIRDRLLCGGCHSTQWLGRNRPPTTVKFQKSNLLLRCIGCATYCTRRTDPTQCAQSVHRKMATLVRAIALAVGVMALSDVSSAAPCRHFSIWNFPWPQRCPTGQTGQFIQEATPTTPSPASPPKPIQDEESQRQQAIQQLKEQLNSQKKP